MASVNREEIKAKVLQSLESTSFAASSLDALSGGTGNFIYRATLRQPLEDGTTEVLVKHSEDYVANRPAFKLPLDRCLVEKCSLAQLNDYPAVGKADASDSYDFIVRTPKFFDVYVENHCQVQEYLQNSIDLKTYALKTYANSNSEATKQQCLQLGKTLGRWLRGFHGWAAQRDELRQLVADNDGMQQIKHTINFDTLLDRIKQFPSILGDAEDAFTEVRDMDSEEWDVEDELQVIHGDFWTGNILLPDAPIQEGVDVPMFVIDWEMAQLGKYWFDLGQMIAELYELKLYKDISGGLWIVEGFVNGYGAVSEGFAFRTAIQVGVHLIGFGTSVPGWGTPEQVENVARTGKDIIVHALNKDRQWFKEGDLASLFSTVSKGGLSEGVMTENLDEDETSDQE
ncbi:kinase-like domain-containing protein [Hypoxylon cercidicola]|nr:kinase-like domain-containing protein [Hypoxylon cercidicola]